MRQGTIDTELAQRVRVALGAVANLCLGDVVRPYTCVGDEETLLGSKAIDSAEGVVAHRILQGVKSHLQTTMVGEILTEGELAVGIEVGQHFDGREEVGIFVCPLGKLLAVVLRPPIGHVAVLVVVASLVVEAVCHLMSDDHTDGTIVEGIVGSHVEEGHLEDTCREADFIGGGVVVCIDGLRSHVPLVAVNRFSCLVVNLPLMEEVTALQHVLTERFLGVNLHAADVLPFVGIAHFYIEGVEFVKGIALGGGIHPVLCLDALCQCHLQVFHQSLHALFGSGREVFLNIDFSERLAHHALHEVGGTLPARMVLLSSGHCLSEEVEVLCLHLIAEQGGTRSDEVPLHI